MNPNGAEKNPSLPYPSKTCSALEISNAQSQVLKRSTCARLDPAVAGGPRLEGVLASVPSLEPRDLQARCARTHTLEFRAPRHPGIGGASRGPFQHLKLSIRDFQGREVIARVQ